MRKIRFSLPLQNLSSLQQERIKLVAVLRAQCRPLTAEPASPVAISEAGAKGRPGLAGHLIRARASPAHGCNEGGLMASVSADAGPTALGLCLAGARPLCSCSGQIPSVRGWLCEQA